jgi:hypothetical protein
MAGAVDELMEQGGVVTCGIHKAKAGREVDEIRVRPIVSESLALDLSPDGGASTPVAYDGLTVTSPTVFSMERCLLGFPVLLMVRQRVSVLHMTANLRASSYGVVVPVNRKRRFSQRRTGSS